MVFAWFSSLAGFADLRPSDLPIFHLSTSRISNLYWSIAFILGLCQRGHARRSQALLWKRRRAGLL